MLISCEILSVQGYVDAAKVFEMESKCSPGVDLSSLADRMEIRNALQSGDVETAIERVNDLDPEILEHNTELMFHLQQQRFIEFIRNGQIDEALEFAQDKLAAKGEDHPNFLEEFERTVSLLVFENPAASPMASLLESGHRARTASELNAAILSAQSRPSKPKLPRLLQLLFWEKGILDDKFVLPSTINISDGRLIVSVSGLQPEPEDVQMTEASD